MGNEESSPIDDSIPPQTLTGRTLDALASYIVTKPSRQLPQHGDSNNKGVRKIVVMTGAGISTSAGIPDFRSPETGLYANLARLNLPFAEAVFDISYFREHPEPFYTLAHELYPGKYRPTLTHSFIRLLSDKGVLLKHFTQNIDCLDREAGVPGEKIVEAHGSFAEQSCIECHAAYPEAEIKKHVAEKSIPRCHGCGGLVKPEIVFFGEQLPEAFFANRMAPGEADLCIVLGTSLTVQPFANLPGLVREDVPRVLINKEAVGGLGSRADDVLLLGDCDDGVRKLARACGWEEELDRLWAATARDGDKKVEAGEAGEKKEEDKKDDLEDEVEKLTKEVDETLNLSKWHEEKVRTETLGEKKMEPRDEKQTGRSNSADLVAFLKHERVDGDLNHVFLTGPKTDAAGSKK